MATTDRTDATAPAEAVAGRLREATFANLLVRADGESLAAAGLLAGACVETGTPYQASVVRTRADVRSRREAADEAATTLPVGVTGDGDALTTTGHPSVVAFRAADALGAEPDPALALAGLVAGGARPEEAAPDVVEAAGLGRRSGLATPTADPADGLAHSTLAHAGYSGDPAAAEAVVARLLGPDGVDSEATAGDDADGVNRRLASLLVIDTVSAEDATERAADAVAWAIHPLAGGPLETVEGYADVLGALAATAPGLGVALAVGGEGGTTTGAALDAWREHAVAVHDGVRAAETERHDGLLVARTDGPVCTVARLLRDFRSPEPAVLAVRDPDPGDDGPGDGRAEAALATVDAPAAPIEPAAEAAGGSGLARGNTGYGRFEADRTDDLVDAVRGSI